MIAGLPIYQKR